MHRAEITSNVVVTARQFNPSIFSQLWLVRGGIISEDDFQPGSIFSDDVAKVEASAFTLFVIPPQLQLMIRQPRDGASVILDDNAAANKVSAIVHRLPETPFTGVGLNFHWQIWSDQEKTNTIAKKLFFKPDNPVFRHFESQDASFGAYASRDALGFRMKLTILPTDLVDGAPMPGPKKQLQFAFNFHFDVPQCENAADLIESKITRWTEAKALASDIVSQVTEANL